VAFDSASFNVKAGRQEREMLKKRSLLAAILFAVTVAAQAVAADTPGVTATEIKIGHQSL
jgi:hypothetical protein